MSWKEKQTEHELKIVQQVAEIVGRGNVARFERPHHDFDTIVVKHVSTTDRDEGTGDLIGSWSDGSTRYVAGWDESYTLTEISQEEAALERGPNPGDPNTVRVSVFLYSKENQSEQA